MCIFPNPIWIAIDAINIAIFLLLWRIVSMGHYGPWLERIKEGAEALLGSFSAAVDQLWYRATQKHLSQRGQLVATTFLIIFGQLVLCGIAGLL